MRNEDNNCIRYLMKEMDPSEELLMERAMMEDEDLLIEVESMRQTLQKLDKLPEVSPPSNVTDAVMEKAAEQAEKNRRSNAYKNPFKMAVAATLALTITASGAWLFVGSESTSEQELQTVTSPQSSASSTAPAQVNESSAAGVQVSDNNENLARPSSAEESTVDPWVDRNDILRFDENFTEQSEQFRTIMDQSAQKLRLIENSIPTNQSVNSVQLTGSGN